MSVTTETTTTQPVPTTMSSTSYDGLIARLDLPSKVRLLTGASMFTLAPEASVDLAEVRLSDGPTGVRGLKFSGGRTVALLPNATLLASTWNEDALAEIGRVLEAPGGERVGNRAQENEQRGRRGHAARAVSVAF